MCALAVKAKGFTNPQNNYREEAPTNAFWCALFFGVTYLLLRGLWSQAAVWLLLIIATSAQENSEHAVYMMIFTNLVLGFYYAINVDKIIEKDYLRRGWKPDCQEESKGQEMWSSLEQSPHGYSKKAPNETHKRWFTSLWRSDVMIAVGIASPIISFFFLKSYTPSLGIIYNLIYGKIYVPYIYLPGLATEYQCGLLVPDCTQGSEIPYKAVIAVCSIVFIYGLFLRKKEKSKS
jgi:hypothetical protein